MRRRNETDEVEDAARVAAVCARVWWWGIGQVVGVVDVVALTHGCSALGGVHSKPRVEAST